MDCRQPLSFSNRQFYLNGKPFCIYSGSIHYFRVVPEYWLDRLSLVKACGLNSVDIYVPWNLHEPKPGHFCNKGRLNIRHFLELASQLGLYVILRPGPFICAEWDFGGLPSWLLADPDMAVRSNYPGYQDAVKRYFSWLLPEIKDFQYSKGGPIIAVQVENEFGSFSCEKEHLEFIHQLLKTDITELLLISDNESSIKTAPLLDGLLPTINGQTVEELKVGFDVIENVNSHYPLMVMELWTGWFDQWKGCHKVRNVDILSRSLQYVLEKNASFNLYMLHGGTNFGFMNGAVVDPGYKPCITSYDYDAPITEDGQTTEKFWRVKELLEDKLKAVNTLSCTLSPVNTVSTGTSFCVMSSVNTALVTSSVDTSPIITSPVNAVVNISPATTSPVNTMVNTSPATTSPVNTMVNTSPVNTMVNTSPATTSPVNTMVNTSPATTSPVNTMVNTLPATTSPVNTMVNTSPATTTPVNTMVNTLPTTTSPVNTTAVRLSRRATSPLTVKIQEMMPWFDLIDLVGKRSTTMDPQFMETFIFANGEIQSYGYIIYRKDLGSRCISQLSLAGQVRDQAVVLVNGQILGQIDCQAEDGQVSLSTSPSGCDHGDKHVLDIVVENLGRVNFAPRDNQSLLNKQRKGLHGPVKVNDVLTRNWQVFALDFSEEHISQITNSDRWILLPVNVQDKKTAGPAVYRGSFHLTGSPGDYFIHLGGWHKGVVIVNGFHLGRYWHVGPQKSLYLPGPVLHAGVNQVWVFEEEVASSEIILDIKPSLG